MHVEMRKTSHTRPSSSSSFAAFICCCWKVVLGKLRARQLPHQTSTVAQRFNVQVCITSIVIPPCSPHLPVVPSLVSTLAPPFSSSATSKPNFNHSSTEPPRSSIVVFYSTMSPKLCQFPSSSPNNTPKPLAPQSQK